MPFYTEEEYEELNTALTEVKEILQNYVDENDGEEMDYYWCEAANVPQFLEEVLAFANKLK